MPSASSAAATPPLPLPARVTTVAATVAAIVVAGGTGAEALVSPAPTTPAPIRPRWVPPFFARGSWAARWPLARSTSMSTSSIGGMDAFGDFDFYRPRLDPPGPRRSQRSEGAGRGRDDDPPVQLSKFYSRKLISDPCFLSEDGDGGSEPRFFQALCRAAGITRPSRIQSLAWPALLRGDSAVVADQTGSGKTLAYLLPLLQRMYRSDRAARGTPRRTRRTTGSPRLLILTPTAELADQIHAVCTSLRKDLSGSSDGWSFVPFVTTAAGSHATNIRDQIRLLQSSPVDVLISTPGRLSTILRTRNAGLDLGHVGALVLDEVDFLLVDETFGPQLRTVGVAVQSGNGEGGDSIVNGTLSSPQFVFVTATLPTDVLESIKSEFPDVLKIRGPGLHRVAPLMRQTLVDVSVPASSNRDRRACFEIKVREMTKALRGRRCDRTLVFCNTVGTCRDVENALRRRDRGGRRSRVWAYHNALSPEVRLRNLRAFSANNDRDGAAAERVLVCTDRAARGIDFDTSPVDHVLLFDFPSNPAEYVRRVGRTARAGRGGQSTVLAYGWQLPIARKIMGLGVDGDKKKGEGNSAKLESFNMMKSDDGWDEEDIEDQYYVRGGARRRKEIASPGGGGTKGENFHGGADGRKKRRRKGTEKGKTWR